MIHASPTFKLLTVLLFLNLSMFFGCTEKSDNLLAPPTETESVVTPDAVPIANLEERTFSRLSAAYPRPLSDESFKTFRALANSEIYLEFLSRAFKPAKPFQTFDELLDTVPPDNENQIRLILKQHLEHIVAEDEDIVDLHKVVVFQQILHIRIRLIILKNFPDPIFDHIPLFPLHLQETRDRVYGSDRVQGWFRWLKNEQVHAFVDAYVAFAKADNDAGRKKLQELFDQHGQDNGLIWLAIQEPTIFWVILNTFTEPFGTGDVLHWTNPEE